MLDRIQEAVGRCSEMNKPLFFYMGSSVTLMAQEVIDALAGLSILSYTADLAAQQRVRILNPQMMPEVAVLAEETLRTSYHKGGHPEMFSREESCPYWGANVYAVMARQMSEVQRQKPGAFLQFGAFAGMDMIPAEIGREVGSVTLAGAGRAATAWNVVAFDYWLLGEELYALAAYVSEDPVALGSIVSSDAGKYLVMAISIIGYILFQLGISIKPFLSA